MEAFPRNRIVNLDETNRRTVAAGICTWATKGSESVSCTVQNSKKEGITVLAAVHALGTKLPLIMIEKGKNPTLLDSPESPTRRLGGHIRVRADNM
jgi:hypothetical protein